MQLFSKNITGNESSNERETQEDEEEEEILLSYQPKCEPYYPFWQDINMYGRQKHCDGHHEASKTCSTNGLQHKYKSFWVYHFKK